MGVVGAAGGGAEEGDVTKGVARAPLVGAGLLSSWTSTSNRNTKSLANMLLRCPISKPAPPPKVKISPSLIALSCILTPSIKVPFIVFKSVMCHW